MKVFLGGTVNNSKWRDYMMPKLEIDYFNPVVDVWTDEAYVRELNERDTCDYCLYVLTPRMTGFYAIAEVVDDSYKRPDRTIFCYLPTDDELKFNKRQINSFEELGKKVEQNGAIWLHSLDEIIAFLNSSKNIAVKGKNEESQMYDIFISYGRRHSKEFAKGLYARLTAMGYKVWFDQNNIPLGVDFQEQINDGIIKADNFIYLISPHSVRSEYCDKEVSLAESTNKRIIPLLHVMPEGEDYNKIKPVIGKRNWIFFQDGINDYETSFNGLISLVESHKEYVHQHTLILNKALDWRNRQKPLALLLSGNKRLAAETWLLKEFVNTQPPCLPSDLHCEYICTSKEVANDYLTDVFLSYSDEELDFPTKIDYALMRKSITTWTKEGNVKAGDIYEEVAHQGIERNTNFLFFVSNKTLKTESCLDELKYAQKLNKRIIPVEIEDVDETTVPNAIKDLYIIEYKDEKRYQEVLDSIFQVINRDKSYYETHKQILVEALEWERNDKKNTFLLTGFELIQAQEWLQKNISRKDNPPLEIQKEFIEKSDISRSTVFITHDRTESLVLASRLEKMLIEIGFNVWLDSSGITEGEEVLEKSKNGIIKADNCIFIVTPQAMDTKLFINEIEFAQKYNKRLFGLIQTDTPEDKLINYPLLNLGLIPFREKIDDLNRSFDKLIVSMEKHSEYIKVHTKYLALSIEWDKRHRNSAFLLTDKERIEAETWLRKSTAIKTLIYQPSLLHCEFICESTKYANNGETDVYISFSISDIDHYTNVSNFLTCKGISVWTDRKQHIERFDDEQKVGIEKSDNFIFLISPSAEDSEYSHNELRYALSCNKRIIPILVEKANIDKFPNLPSKSIDITALHDVKRNEELKASVEEILKIINTEKEYYRWHKIYFSLAMEWERTKLDSLLLRGNALENAETWLQENSKRTINPVTVLENTFISESRSRTDNLSIEVFVSFVPENYDFANRLNYLLKSHGKTTWFDRININSPEDVQVDILEAIEAAVNFLPVLTPHYSESKECINEITEASKHNKRIIPILYTNINLDTLPTELSRLQTINFLPSEREFLVSFGDLLRTLDTDRDYVQSHTKWLKKAHEWDKSNRPSDLLLRGSEYEMASKWLETAKQEGKTPKVTPLQNDFILVAEKAIRAALLSEKRWRLVKTVSMIVMGILLVISIGLGLKTAQKTKQAQMERQKAENAQLDAMEKRQLAEKAKEAAIKAEIDAKKAEERATQLAEAAKISEGRAKKSEVSAKFSEAIAKDKEAMALIEKNNAEKAKKEALSAKEIADKEKKKAETEKENAEVSRKKAERLLTLSEAKSMSSKSIQVLKDGNLQPALQLALHSYYLLLENDSTTQNNENYQALYQSLNAADKKEAKKNVKDKAQKGLVTELIYCPEKNLIISGGEDKVINFWKRTNAAIENVGHIDAQQRISRMALSNEGNRLIVGTKEGRMLFYNTNNLQEKPAIMDFVKGRIEKFSTFSYGKQQLLLVVNDSKLFIFDISNTIPKTFIWASDSLKGVRAAFITERKGAIYVIAGGKQKKLEIWKTSNEQISSLTKQESIEYGREITALAASNDGKFFAIGTLNGAIETRKMDTYENKGYSLLGHTSQISQIEFDKNSRQLASASFDHTARLWRFKYTEKEEVIILNHSGWVSSIAYDSSDNSLITGDQNGCIRVWATRPEVLANALCSKVEKKLTREELKKYTQATINYKKKNCVSFD